MPTVNSTRFWEFHPADYFTSCLQIEDRATSKVSPFRLNSHQRQIQDAIDQQRRENKPVRVMILKPRQTGISTLSCANVFHSCRFGMGTSMVVSKDLDSAEHIFSIIQRYHYYLPEAEKAHLVTQASNRKELKFAPPNGGRIIVDTAGKGSAGHSFTIRNLLLSEVSRWPEGCDDTIIGLLNAVHNVPGTSIIIESVANGAQGWFYDEWRKTNSQYVKVFLPWFEHSDYKAVLPTSRDKYNASLTEAERVLESRHDLSLEQIEWRRWAVTNNCRDNVDKFKEQYPSTAAEAFLTSGNAFFSVASLDSIEPTPPLTGDLRELGDEAGVVTTTFVQHPQGKYSLWKKPQRLREYVLAADVAEGIEIEGAPADSKHDFSSADVLDRDTGEQVCHLHGYITPDEFGRMLAQLGRWYNDAYVCVESNAGYGLHVLDEMKDSQYPESLMYRQQTMDEGTKRPTTKLGWRTTKANRKTLMSNLDMALRRQEIIINSQETLDELRSFITKPDGRIEHGAGHKDDRVFSLAMAYEMLGAAPPMKSKSGAAPMTSIAPQNTSYTQRRLTDHGSLSIFRPN